MNCDHVKKRLPALLDRELSESDKFLVEGHLRHCENCRKEKFLLQETWAAAGTIPAPAVSPDFSAHLMRRIREQQAKKLLGGISLPEICISFELPRWAPALAAVCLMVTVGFLAFHFSHKARSIEKKMAPVVTPSAAQGTVTVSDEDIIRNLNIYENIDLFQNYTVLKDWEVIQSPV